MALLQRKAMLDNNRVNLIAPDLISPNPDQPRQYFDPEGLQELADSIRLHGILQPLTVRRRSGGRYELVAGERRLRAAQLCGLSEVPCLIVDITRESSCVLSLIENLQRRDLDFLEEAQALERLIRIYGLSQEEAATKIGKSQSAVANKLRLLRLAPDILDILRQNGGTERHARALLRLPDEGSQRVVAQLVVERGLTVALTEQYVAEYLASLCAPPALPPPTDTQEPVQAPANKEDKPGKRTAYVIRDVRFFLNSINHSLSVMKSAGVNAQCDQVDEADSILLTIRIPKHPPAPLSP